MSRLFFFFSLTVLEDAPSCCTCLGEVKAALAVAFAAALALAFEAALAPAFEVALAPAFELEAAGGA
jgi:hypothetical protein